MIEKKTCGLNEEMFIHNILSKEEVHACIF